MQNVMDYEIIDWQTEAARVARAFGIEGECCFKLCEKQEGSVRWEESYVLWQEHWIDELPLPKLKGVSFSCDYHMLEGKSFYIGRFEDDFDHHGSMAGVTFDWKNRPMLQSRSIEYAPLLAKGLFHLGLLTVEVEALLQVTVAAHQKMEWRLEYDERLKL